MQRALHASPWAWVGVLSVLLLIIGVITTSVEKTWRQQTADAIAGAGTMEERPRETVFHQRPRVAFLGDSYAEGIGTDHVSKAYVMIAARELGWTGRQFAVGGTGYSGPPGQSYGDRLQNVVDYSPTHVFVCGSRNDAQAPPGLVKARATELHERVRKELPDATLVVVGPIWVDDSPPPEISRVNEELRTAAEDADAVFIDVLLDPWLDGSSDVIGPDGVHATEAGHRVLADRLVAEIQKAGLV